jgi:hypothetical protein
MTPPDAFIHSLSRMERSTACEVVEAKLQEAFVRIDQEPAVAKLLARIGAEGFIVSHYTFDEPYFETDHAQVQFTYHLSDGHGGSDRQEIRGSGIAIIDDHGAVRLEDVDAEVYLLVDDLPNAEIRTDLTD